MESSYMNLILDLIFDLKDIEIYRPHCIDLSMVSLCLLPGQVRSVFTCWLFLVLHGDASANNFI